jgi:D-tyrosyl-tRNA(Tyr) deacylase
MLELDNIDEHFAAATTRKPTDLVFISKHASSSGAPALTVSKPHKTSNETLNPTISETLNTEP